MDSNLSLQIDEIEALTSIYEDKVEVISEAARKYLFKISSSPQYVFNLQVQLPTMYPGSVPPEYELHAPWLKATEKEYINEHLNRIYAQSCGNSILYEWIEYVKDYVETKIPQRDEQNMIKNEKLPNPEVVSVPTIIHGEPFTDRRSTFQAHLAKINHVANVKIVREALLSNRKISNATHNIVAYRICNNGVMVQDCDDDGETAAGGRLLHLLQILDVTNVVIIVSRWYGGILLGPDRFKHINNVARTLLVQEGFVKQKR